MANHNTNLHKAKSAKDDEFYTTYETVEAELRRYEAQLRGMAVLCNCDDPYTSNFARYFINNFERLGLRRLVCTSYGKSVLPTGQMSLFDDGKEWNVESDGYGRVLDIDHVSGSVEQVLGGVKRLRGDGDFRSKECEEYLKECDVVVTNPPFSLLRDFVGRVMKYGKKFLAICGQNAITYKEIFPLIQQGVVWTGYGFGEMKFRVPKDSEPRSMRYWVDEGGQKWRSLGNAMWLTNLDNEKRHRILLLTHCYDPEIHRKYDNYDAIHVRNIKEIPRDYAGIMGVPITIVNLYNREQFEIVGEANHGSDNQYDLFKPMLDGKDVFKRVLIKNRML